VLHPLKNDGHQNRPVIYSVVCRLLCLLQLHLSLALGFKKPRFLKKAQPTGFLYILCFGLFGFFYLTEQLGSLLVDLAHQLSFYLDLLVL